MSLSKLAGDPPLEEARYRKNADPRVQDWTHLVSFRQSSSTENYPGALKAPSKTHLLPWIHPGHSDTSSNPDRLHRHRQMAHSPALIQ